MICINYVLIKLRENIEPRQLKELEIKKSIAELVNVYKYVN